MVIGNAGSNHLCYFATTTYFFRKKIDKFWKRYCLFVWRYAHLPSFIIAIAKIRKGQILLLPQRYWDQNSEPLFAPADVTRNKLFIATMSHSFTREPLQSHLQTTSVAWKHTLLSCPLPLRTNLPVQHHPPAAPEPYSPSLPAWPSSQQRVCFHLLSLIFTGHVTAPRFWKTPVAMCRAGRVPASLLRRRAGGCRGGRRDAGGRRDRCRETPGAVTAECRPTVRH